MAGDTGEDVDLTNIDLESEFQLLYGGDPLSPVVCYARAQTSKYCLNPKLANFSPDKHTHSHVPHGHGSRGRMRRRRAEGRAGTEGLGRDRRGMMRDRAMRSCSGFAMRSTRPCRRRSA